MPWERNGFLSASILADAATGLYLVEGLTDSWVFLELLLEVIILCPAVVAWDV